MSNGIVFRQLFAIVEFIRREMRIGVAGALLLEASEGYRLFTGNIDHAFQQIVDCLVTIRRDSNGLSPPDQINDYVGARISLAGPRGTLNHQMRMLHRCDNPNHVAQRSLTANQVASVLHTSNGGKFLGKQPFDCHEPAVARDNTACKRLDPGP